MIVCVCHAIPDSALRAAAAAGMSPEEFARATGAGSSCGCCVETVSALLAENDPCDCPGSAPCPGCPRAGRRQAAG